MVTAASLILIDSDMRRRAAISHALSAADIHVEPFENIAELASAWPRAGVILVHDEAGATETVIEAMAMRGDWFPVIAFSEAPTTARIVQAVLNGAIDYLVWPLDANELLAGVHRSLTRAEHIVNTRLREAMARSRIERLTRRERQVLSCIARGLSNRLIGQKLEISPRTVEIHRANMLNKLNASHTSEAIRIAIEADIGE